MKVTRSFPIDCSSIVEKSSMDTQLGMRKGRRMERDIRVYRFTFLRLKFYFSYTYSISLRFRGGFSSHVFYMNVLNLSGA